MMYPASSPARRSSCSNKGVTSKYRDYDLSTLQTCETKCDSSAQTENARTDTQPLYRPYQALVGLSNKYAESFAYQPNPNKTYTDTVPQYASYQPYSGFSDNFVQQCTSQPSANVYPAAENKVFVMEGVSWKEYDVENVFSI